MPDDHYGDRNT